MKVSKIEIGATIPTTQYGNIQPKIELTDVEVSEGRDIALSFIKDLYGKYSEKGPLKENKDLELYVTKQSFNEDVEIQYDDLNHVYLYKGERLTSATGVKSQYYTDFDTENISKISAKAWGVEQEELKELWSSNSTLTTDFGTVVHKALEHYYKFKAIGEAVQEFKALSENYCLPKHPILRSIILEFLEVNKTVGDVVPEALITNVERKLCGHSDSVLVTDWKKKVCRVQDYKVNVESELVSSSKKAKAPFDKLPHNKLTGYQIQLSVYANLLALSGWTVEGLDVFVYEEGWKHFPLDVLKVIE